MNKQNKKGLTISPFLIPLELHYYRTLIQKELI